MSFELLRTRLCKLSCYISLISRTIVNKNLCWSELAKCSSLSPDLSGHLVIYPSNWVTTLPDILFLHTKFTSFLPRLSSVFLDRTLSLSESPVRTDLLLSSPGNYLEFNILHFKNLCFDQTGGWPVLRVRQIVLGPYWLVTFSSWFVPSLLGYNLKLSDENMRGGGREAGRTLILALSITRLQTSPFGTMPSHSLTSPPLPSPHLSWRLFWHL